MMESQETHLAMHTSAARITLEDVIEAATRGVLRALATEEAEVSGYLTPVGPTPVGNQLPPPYHRPIILGIPVFPPYQKVPVVQGGERLA